MRRGRWVAWIVLFALAGPPSHARADTPPPFLTKWAACGASLAIDPAGRVLVADSFNSLVRIFATDGTFLGQWSTTTTNGGRIAVDPSGNVYAVPYGGGVNKFTSEGSYLLHFAPYGGGPGQLWASRDVDVGPDGKVYVTDDGGLRIAKFEQDGTFILEWGYPTYPALHPFGIAVDRDGFVYVTDSQDHFIKKYTSTGAFIRTIGGPSGSFGGIGSTEGQLNQPHGLDFDGIGNIYVADTFNHRVVKFAPDGVFLTAWGSRGSGDGQFEYPQDVEVDALGRVYVADGNNCRIQVFGDGPTLAVPASWGKLKATYR